jgi:hypothetical protein
MSLNDLFSSSARPARVSPWATEAARWAQRMSRAPYKNFIRELAGLGDGTLSQIEAQTRERPQLRMPRSWRFAVGGTVGLALVGAGLLATGLEARRIPGLEQAEEALQWSGIGLLAFSLLSAIVCALLHVRNGPAMRAYPELAVHVARLDEQHPWLYETLETARQADAEAYRLKTLATRGLLRGVDLPMMRLVMAAQAEVLRSHTANEVVHALQTGHARTVPQGAAVEIGNATRQSLQHVPVLDESAMLDEPTLLDDERDEGDEGGNLLHFPSNEDQASGKAVTT